MNESNILKIGTFSILSYLIFRICFYTLTSILLCLNIKLQVSNEIVIVIFHIIICGIIPCIILTQFVFKSLFNPKIPGLKTICFLFIVLITITFLNEGIDILSNKYMPVLEDGQFKDLYWSLYYSLKHPLFLTFSLIILFLFIRKFNTLEKSGSENHSEVLKFGILSVLSFLVFEKFYLLMNLLFHWIYAVMKIDNELIILSCNILYGISSILFLIVLLNISVIKNNKTSKKTIYSLLFIAILITFTVMLNYTLLIPKFAIEDDLTYLLFKFNWSEIIKNIIMYLGITYLLWKLFSERKAEDKKPL